MNAETKEITNGVKNEWEENKNKGW
jgi:hypothetical protein